MLSLWLVADLTLLRPKSSLWTDLNQTETQNLFLFPIDFNHCIDFGKPKLKITWHLQFSSVDREQCWAKYRQQQQSITDRVSFNSFRSTVMQICQATYWMTDSMSAWPGTAVKKLMMCKTAHFTSSTSPSTTPASIDAISTACSTSPIISPAPTPPSLSSSP